MNKLKFLNKIKEMGFSYLRISLTKDCNGACSFCHNEGQKIGKRGINAVQNITLLSLDDYEYIANFFKDYLDSISLTGGEPTLAKNLPEIIKIFKSKGYIVRMTTNAFLLDEALQKKLQLAGLDAVNVSLSTLKEDEHAKMFNVKDKLSVVLKNLDTLPQYFTNKVKINFMALEENVPEQLLPISMLSAKLGITVSFLTTLDNTSKISKDVLQYLIDKIGIKKEEEKDGKFGKKNIYTLNNGAVWEFDDFRQEKYKILAFSNNECQMCMSKQNCVEGPYALRISDNGIIRPCLIRMDNIIKLTKRGYFNERVK